MSSTARRLAVPVLLTPLLALLVGPLPVGSASAAQGECGIDDVVVVVEPATLGGDDLIRCAGDLSEGASALEALAAAGLSYDETSGSAPMLCRIEDRPGPSEESCGGRLSGEGYWAFLVANDDRAWLYAMHGPRDHTTVPGEMLAFRYQRLADGEDVEVSAKPDRSTRAQAERVSGIAGGEEAGSSSPERTNSARDWVAPAAFAAVLVGLVVVGLVLARRRRG